MADVPEPKLRQSVRALVVDERDRMLLVRLKWPTPEGEAVFWAHPGGGVEPGETPLQALRRELDEETGIQIDELGPEVWTKTALFDIEGCQGQVDHIYLQRVADVDLAPRLSPEELGAEHVYGMRWWTPDEIAHSAQTFAPRCLSSLYADLLRDGPPAEPVILTGF